MELYGFSRTWRHFRWGCMVDAGFCTCCRWDPWGREKAAQFPVPLEIFFSSRKKCRRNTYIYICVDRRWCEELEYRVRYVYKWISAERYCIYMLSRLCAGIRGSTSFHWTQGIMAYTYTFYPGRFDHGLGSLISEHDTFNGHLNQVRILGIMTKMNSQKAH